MLLFLWGDFILQRIIFGLIDVKKVGNKKHGI